jgi:hypothetical protein
MAKNLVIVESPTKCGTVFGMVSEAPSRTLPDSPTETLREQFPGL